MFKYQVSISYAEKLLKTLFWVDLIKETSITLIVTSCILHEISHDTQFACIFIMYTIRSNKCFCQAARVDKIISAGLMVPQIN